MDISPLNYGNRLKRGKRYVFVNRLERILRIAMMIEPEKDRILDWIFQIRKKAVYNNSATPRRTSKLEQLQNWHRNTNMELTYFVGFLDGINDLKNPNPIEEMEADTVVSLDYDKEALL